MEEGEKNTKYFYNLERKKSEFTFIHKLNIDGKENENPKDISKYVSEFNGKLYTSNGCPTSDISAFLDSVKDYAKFIDFQKSSDRKKMYQQVKREQISRE